MKIAQILLISIFILLTTSTFAIAHEGIENIDEIVGLIMAEQGVSEESGIDCSKVSDLRFEQLGDSVMERMIGDHELHEQMDAMMGGEGSASLTSMHTAMGKNWLGCQTSFQSMMNGGMMGGGMMPMMMRIMGNYYPAYYSNYNTVFSVGIVGWVLFGILLVIFVMVRNGTIKFRKH